MWREPEAREEPIIGAIDSEAVPNEDEAMECGGSSDETSTFGRRQRRAQSMMMPAKNGMSMSSAPEEGRNTD